MSLYYSDMTLIESNRFSLTKESAFRIFKVVIFWVLMINLFYYLYEDVTAFLYLAPGSTTFRCVGGLCGFSIDYVAWMVLIVLFEMETSAQARDRFTGTREWVIAGLVSSLLCGSRLCRVWLRGGLDGLATHYRAHRVQARLLLREHQFRVYEPGGQTH